MGQRRSVVWVRFGGALAAAALVWAAGQPAAAAGCGAHQDQICPAQVVPQAVNEAELAEAVVNTQVPDLPIASLIKQDEQSEPSSWEGPTAPALAPTKKLSIALISCSSSLHGCVTPLLGAAAAAKFLGWTTTMYDGGGTPTTWNKAFLDAVSSGADAVLFTSINPLLIQQGLDAAKNANIPVISASAGSSEPNPTVAAPPGKIWPLIDVSQNFVQTGRQIADWIIGDSGGKANILDLTDREYTSGISQAGVIDELNKKCPDCKISTFNFEGATVGTTLAGQTVGYLRTHPEINYLVAPYDPAAAAIVPAMAQAGITGVKVCSLLGDQQNLNFIKQGEIQACDAAFDNDYMGWAMVDQFVRHLNNMPFAQPLGENTPLVLLDKSNLPPAGTDWGTTIDYQSHYKKLWKGG
jgi:ribose transport system substrate-binding protein